MGSSSGQSSGSYDLSFKILVIGDSGVGKSSLLVSFISNTIENLSPTIGTFFLLFLLLFFKLTFTSVMSKDSNFKFCWVGFSAFLGYSVNGDLKICDEANVVFLFPRLLNNQTESKTVGSMTRFFKTLILSNF